MPTRIRFTRSADRELDEIVDYLTAEIGPRRARRIIDRMRERIRALRDNPRLGPARDSLGVGRRVLILRPYLAIYQIDLDGGVESVLVLHIVHGARDVETILRED